MTFRIGRRTRDHAEMMLTKTEKIAKGQTIRVRTGTYWSTFGYAMYHLDYPELFKIYRIDADNQFAYGTNVSQIKASESNTKGEHYGVIYGPGTMDISIRLVQINEIEEG